MNCYVCNSSQHFLQKCPILHYLPDQEKIILKNNFPVDVKDRQICLARRPRYQNTWQNMEALFESKKQFNQVYQKELEVQLNDEDESYMYEGEDSEDGEEEEDFDAKEDLQINSQPLGESRTEKKKRLSIRKPTALVFQNN